MKNVDSMKNLDDILFDDAIEKMLLRARQTAESHLQGFPHYADVETGNWTTTNDGFWTGGFWPGTLWLAGYYSGDTTFWQEAAQWNDSLESRVESDSVFRGFLFYFGSAVGADLAANERAAELAVRAAQSLCSTFRPHTGLMPLGSSAEEAHTVGENETNIDSLSASLVLAWASERTGNPELKRVAIEHALTNADFCVREDGSVCQSASFDSESGKLLRTYTHKGYALDSTWARAQAWAMVGYAYLATKMPEEPRFLCLADRVCRWWMDNVPQDLVAYWDFDAPQEDGTKRDTSATAIAAYAMLKLASVHEDRRSARDYQRLARETVRVLCRDYLTPTADDDQRPVGILTQGCFDHTRGVATENELIWGDYFLLKALGVLTGALPVDRPR
ncbi:glycoside hydrolase family 88 protein [Halomonas sp. M5N1S17]|uniref:glycoside hydrolase family 88 protein n=1 Tax=Halomonas alkalisoli TaxID=2907158 RepID=UPI001F3E6718|nr:glycoside hydrolase family 88 protein [Halomonas alkalisoli]MCE9662046.1 glycoside hydrolase family 88 protein [Halomonas alkalisoli]